MRRRDYASTLFYLLLSGWMLRRAVVLSEETSASLVSCIHTIQDAEIDQLREITAFLDLEMRFAKQYLEALTDAKMQWPDEYDPFPSCRSTCGSLNRGQPDGW
jgi:hypothetical protein